MAHLKLEHWSIRNIMDTRSHVLFTPISIVDQVTNTQPSSPVAGSPAKAQTLVVSRRASKNYLHSRQWSHRLYLWSNNPISSLFHSMPLFSHYDPYSLNLSVAQCPISSSVGLFICAPESDLKPPCTSMIHYANSSRPQHRRYHLCPHWTNYESLCTY